MLIGTYPPAGPAGSLYDATDSPTHLWFNDAGTWRPMANDVVGTTPPAAATFTATGGGGLSSVSDDLGTVKLTINNDAAYMRFQSALTAFNSAVGSSVVCALSRGGVVSSVGGSNYFGHGLGFHKQDGTYAGIFLVDFYYASQRPALKYYDAGFNPVTNIDHGPVMPSIPGAIQWWRAVRTIAGSVVVSWSNNAIDWNVLCKLTEGIGNLFDRIGPMGLCHDIIPQTTAVDVHVHSWVQT